MAGAGRRGLSDVQRRELWDRWGAGESISAIGRALGRPPGSVFSVLRSNGGYVPPRRCRRAGALSLEEREEISRGLARGESLRGIARRLERAPNTIRTARSRISSGYFPRRRCSVMAPSSQGSEPAQYPVRFNPISTMPPWKSPPLLASLFSPVKAAWDWLRSGRRVRISTDEVPGPTTREYGFSQSSVRVAVANKGGNGVEIQEIRLMFARRFGIPLMEAPPPLTHPALPAAVDPGTQTVWYFPAETLAIMLGRLSLKSRAKEGDAKLRAGVVTADGNAYRSRWHRFSLNINAHWL